MNNTNRKISEKSKKRMANALFTIMEQYDLRDITITQIAQASGLTRRTFYRLFDAKEDVLQYQYELWFTEIYERVKAEKRHSYWDVAQCYFDFCEKNREALLLMKKQNIIGDFFSYIESNTLQVFESVHSKEIAQRNPTELPYLMAYSVGGMFSMLNKWIDNDMDIPFNDLIRILKNAYKSTEL